jgi:hypothetical protein
MNTAHEREDEGFISYVRQRPDVYPYLNVLTRTELIQKARALAGSRQLNFHTIAECLENGHRDAMRASKAVSEPVPLAPAPVTRGLSAGGAGMSKQDGCPCGDTCCDNPDVDRLEHECPTDEFCEDCYASHCNNCHRTCWCDL